MDWIERKSFRGLSPEFAQILVWREAIERLESTGEVVGSEEVVQVRFESIAPANPMVDVSGVCAGRLLCQFCGIGGRVEFGQ